MFEIKFVEKIKTRVSYSVTFSKSRAIYEIMSDNMMEPEKTQIIWRLRVAYWISKPTRSREHACVCVPTPSLSLTHTHTHTHRRTHTHAFIHARTYAEIFSTYCFPRQQWFRERAFNVPLHIHCLCC